MNKKGFGVSPLTNTIFYGTQDTIKHTWVGRKKDVTSDVIAAIFEWFIGNMNGNAEYSITYPDTPYELVMRKKADSNQEWDFKDVKKNIFGEDDND